MINQAGFGKFDKLDHIPVDFADNYWDEPEYRRAN